MTFLIISIDLDSVTNEDCLKRDLNNNTLDGFLRIIYADTHEIDLSLRSNI
jgi:hypothetical protein